ncbi:MAG: hypothetical protein JF887_09695 [Candidatus Dormibacteraeota bacterium]|uniref:Uncharacterized protein n=1 Tax=Candidatus Amunia macphersoniae TaxID=3127014 RepID=A0A934NGT2_9BACT|nr:hypothetical protein [Candidatus Dormibacteraeota bacterium]
MRAIATSALTSTKAPRSTITVHTNPYQFSLRTSRVPGEVLDDVAARPLPGIAVAERGPHYLVLRPQRRYRYGSDIAAGAAVVIVLAVLIATALTPVLIVLLPLAALPALPLLLDHRPDLAVSAIVDDGGGTRVTVHGEASSELAAAVDAFLGALPEAPPPPPPDLEDGTSRMASTG